MYLIELRPELPTSKKKIEIPRLQNSIHLGAGIQGFARGLTKRPNTVVKIALTSDHDAYEQFLRLCLAHQDNPFFPRIKAVKKYRMDTLSVQEHRTLLTDLGVKTPDMPTSDMLDNLRWIVIIAMERLVPIKDNSVKRQIPQMLHSLYGEELMDSISGKVDEEDLFDISSMLSLLHYYKEGIICATPNKQFKNALRLLTPLWKKWRMDIKHQNIMIRPTPEGPQLVFLDPIWSNPSGSQNFSYQVLDYF